MNPMAQPGTHPDADLLSAFAERALPQADRLRIMSHLADCARCREIAYLAQAAAAEEIAPAPAITPQPNWLSAAVTRWRIALIPAAALAAVGAVVLWVQIHPASRPVEMAQLNNQPPEPAPAPPPRQAGPTEQNTQSAAPRTSSASSKATGERPSEDRPNQAAARPPLPTEKPSATFNSAIASPLPSLAPQSRAPGGVRLDSRSAAQARFAPFPPNGPPDTAPYLPAQQPSAAVFPQGRTALAAATPGRVPAPPPATGLLNVQGEGTDAATVGPTQVALQSLQQAELVAQPMNGLPVLRLARRAKLPSGLNTVSSAVLLNRLVAVDSAGAVFLSHDGGKRWEPVRPQWSGKAIEVQAPHQLAYRLMSTSANPTREVPPNPSQASVETMQDNTPALPPPPALSVSSSPASPSNPTTALPGPPMFFKLVTDRHKVWLSPDGKNWREQ